MTSKEAPGANSSRHPPIDAPSPGVAVSLGVATPAGVAVSLGVATPAGVAVSLGVATPAGVAVSLGVATPAGVAVSLGVATPAGVAVSLGVVAPAAVVASLGVVAPAAVAVSPGVAASLARTAHGDAGRPPAIWRSQVPLRGGLAACPISGAARQDTSTCVAPASRRSTRAVALAARLRAKGRECGGRILRR
ncbi:hypothetical protein [Micromonospora globbae]|uniref:hypothetical protein n=1 Tax=Micromonospora globbae TaxID=1894969 RepID=UPI003864E245|nr:hypothetical protein OH732_17735 [Micromonospora globbae]